MKDESKDAIVWLSISITIPFNSIQFEDFGFLIALIEFASFKYTTFGHVDSVFTKL